MKFYTWLMHNRWRSDPIGDIAREVHVDTTWPKQANDWEAVRAALPDSAADKVRAALHDAWEEYELYVGGASQLKPDTWVYGVTGSAGLKPAKNK